MASVDSRLEARRILDGAARALGGLSAVAGVETLYSRADVTGPAGSFETVIYSAADGRARMTQTTGFHAGLRPSGDWIVPNPEAGRRPLPAELRQVVRGHELHMIFLAPETRFTEPMALEPGTFRGEPALSVRMFDDAGRPVGLYFSATDTLPMGIRLETDGGGVDAEVGDWRTENGLELFWTAQFRDRTGAFAYTYTDIRVNDLVDADFLPFAGE